MKCYVVTEGYIDTALLNSLLFPPFSPDDVLVIPREGTVIASMGQSPAVSMARTLLASGHLPIALIIDAETTSEDRIRELRVTLEETLALAGPRNRFGVFVAVPTLTACLFLDEPGLRKLFGAELTTERLIRSRFEPDKVLDELLSATGRPPLNNAAIVGLVGSLDKSRLQQFPAIRSLVQFIESAVRAVPA